MTASRRQARAKTVAAHDSRRQRRLPSIVQALVLFVLLLPVYPLVFPYYETAVVYGARLFLTASPGAVWIETLPSGGWLVTSPGDHGQQESLTFNNERFSRLSLQDLLIITCLLLATPVPWTSRARLCAIGIACVLIATAGSLASCAGALSRWCAEDTSGRLCRNLAGALSPWSHVVCFAVWMGLAGRYWIGGPDPAHRAGGTSRRPQGGDERRPG